MHYSPTINDAMNNTYRSSQLADAFLHITMQEFNECHSDLPIDVSQIANILADYTADYCSENRADIFPLWQQTRKLLNSTEILPDWRDNQNVSIIAYGFHKHGVDGLKEILTVLSQNMNEDTGLLRSTEPYKKIVALYALVERDQANSMLDIMVRLVDVTESLKKLDKEELRMYIPPKQH